MLMLRRPTLVDLAQLAAAQRAMSFTYQGVGGTLTGRVPNGYRYEDFVVPLSHGDDVFGRARDALREWLPQRGDGISVAADGPLAAGTTVALAAPLPIGFAVAVCRVVDVIDNRHGGATWRAPIDGT